MSLMEKFADPEAMHSLSVPEKLAGAGVTAIMGIGVTFLVLFLLWGCIALMNRINSSEMLYRKPAGEEDVHHGEITAVIAAAAIAAQEAPAGFAGDPVQCISVRQIKRAAGESWARAGRWENMR